MDYKNSGVDIEAGYKSVELMKKYVKGTMRPEVLGGLGGFSGAFSMESFKNMEKPTLVSGTDGCGTKVKLAFLLDKHDTIGIDCVAMCVNDIACAGGEPLFFLDYIACGKNYPEKIATIVSGVAEGCKQAGCALIGGETAEHPGLMPEDEYDLAGFSVGIVDEKDIITGADLAAGDVLIGMASSGVHSNGFSLVRKIFSMDADTLNTYHEELGKTLGEALLAPTRIYVKALREVKEAGVRVKACSHITGGGFYENIPRMLPEGKHAVIRKDSYEVPAIFQMMAREGKVEEQMMYNTYNMGIGMIVAVDPADVDIITGADLAAGDVLIGMASSGVHSNGFSLVRKIFSMDADTLNTYHEELGKTLGEALLAPTRIYVKALREVKEAGVRVKACSHITGGGFYENIPRMLPEGKHAVIRKDSYEVPAIFQMMAREGKVEEQMMYNTYNMGIGMIVAVDPADVDKTIAAMKAAGDTPYIVGEIKDGEKGVTLC